jgi:uncharacterized protein YjbI with pentapeptide repeats
VLVLVDENHLEILKKGVAFWYNWRRENLSIQPDLTEADLSRADLAEAYLMEANLIRANLTGANLRGANFYKAILSNANLAGANLAGANLSSAELSNANLAGANLTGASLNTAELNDVNLSNANLAGADLRSAKLFEADLTGANLAGADLFEASLLIAKLTHADFTEANLTHADLTGVDLTGASLKRANMTGTRMVEVKLNGTALTDCRVFGISAWDLKGLEEAEQSNLVITPEGEPDITVDNLEFAQFIYILLHSEKVRNVIDTMTSKAVLILGRFTAERKVILEAIKEELRKRNYLPILFDFEKPASRDLTETISTLAHMSRFIIADITDPKSVPQELTSIIPFLTSVPVQPILLASQREYALFEHFKHYPWVLNIYRYTDIDDLLRSLGEKVIVPAEDKAKELQKR